MYLVVEEGTRVFRLVVGGIPREGAIATARRLCRERGKPMRVRDTDTGAVLYTARPEVEPRRKAADCPPKCHGTERQAWHSIQCRPARPACRWRRRERGICHCDRYHFPHRDGSGFCGNEQAYIEHLMTPRRRAA